MNAPFGRSGRWSGRVVATGANHDVTGHPGANSAPERLSSAGAGGHGAARRVGRRRLARIEADLSERELAILRDVARFRFLTTSQVQTLHFAGHATHTAGARICRRVLARLAELRVIEHLERRIGGIRAGSASYVWRVGVVGDRLLRAASGEGGRARRKEPSTRYLDHTLAIADCYLALVRAVRQGWLAELLQVETEPDSWRRFLGAGGQREILKPDLRVVAVVGVYEDAWWVEIDRASESLPTLVRKCREYERYRRTGHEQEATGVFPRVLWVVPDETRAAKLTAAVRQARQLDADLFRITTMSRFIETVAGGSA